MSGLILASGSAIRAHLLRQAGLHFDVRVPAIDEEALKHQLRAQSAGAEAQVTALSAAKASSISQDWPDHLVLGCDQMLVCEGQVFDKPRDRADAHRQLQFLGGKAHQLLTGAALAFCGAVFWQTQQRPRLRMRALRDAAIDAYLDQMGEAAFTSVGAYQLEGLGVQLFSEIDGDWFSILGLPLLPILEALRQRGFALP